MSKKHLLVVTQYFYPEQFRINDICCEWIKRGYQITVLTGIPNYPKGKFYEGYGFRKKRKEYWNGIQIIRIPIIPRGNHAVTLLLNYISFVISGYFWNKNTALDADSVFIFEVSPMTQALCGVWYAKKHRIPCAIYVQDLWPENVEVMAGIKSRWILWPVEKMVQYIYENSDRIFAASESFAKLIKKRLPGKEAKVCYWPQYAEDFCIPMGKIKRRNNFTVIFTGNIGKAQGLSVLPKAAAILKEKKYMVNFILVGDGRYKERLVREVKECHVEDGFQFWDKVPPERIPQILSESDAAFVSFLDNTIFSNTIPAKLQTYMACGIPVLASANGETRKLIEISKCGICCECGNAIALADAMIQLMAKSKEELWQMGNNGYEYSRRHFNKKILMDKMDSYFRQNINNEGFT